MQVGFEEYLTGYPLYQMAMLSDPSAKYRPFPQVPLPDRQWPGRTIARPPRWL
jgi:2-isopropylmalate synthase